VADCSRHEKLMLQIYQSKSLRYSCLIFYLVQVCSRILSQNHPHKLFARISFFSLDDATSHTLFIKDNLIIANLDTFDRLSNYEKGQYSCYTCSFSDTFFNGNKRVFDFGIESLLSSDKTTSHLHKVVVRQMGEDLHLFLKSQEKQSVSQGDPLSGLTAVQSNVKGGLGVFGAFYSTEYSLLIE